MKHTPTPWFVRKEDAFNPERWGAITHEWTDGEEKGESTIAEVCDGELGIAESDAKFIVRAVNNHDRLVEVLEGLLLSHESPSTSEWLEESIEKAKAALAAAKEES